MIGIRNLIWFFIKGRMYAKNKYIKKVYSLPLFIWLKLNGSYIGNGARIYGRPVFPHGITGIFISSQAVIGKGSVIYHHVTIGSNTTFGSNRNGSPIIGDNCYIGAGAKIIGKVTIGDNVRIGANAVVVKDIPSNSVVVNQPARIIEKAENDNSWKNVNKV